MAGPLDGVLDGAVAAHGGDRRLKIPLADAALRQRALPEGALLAGAAAERQQHRQGDLAFAEIVAGVLAELCRDPAIVERVVDQLEGDAEIGAKAPAGGDRRLVAAGEDRADLAGGSEQRRRLGADHGEIFILGRRGVFGGGNLHHLAFGDHRGGG